MIVVVAAAAPSVANTLSISVSSPELCSSLIRTTVCSSNSPFIETIYSETITVIEYSLYFLQLQSNTCRTSISDSANQR